MAAYFNQKTKKWDANFSYKDYENNSKKKMKRGFQTKEEAEAWETEYKELCKKDMSKTFGEFYKNYESDIRPRVKESTWRSKEYVIKHKILPYYQDKPMNSIKPLDILKWQNELLEMHNKKGNELSGTYLKTIQSQLSAIFNHAVRYYDLNGNPVKKAGPIGIVRANEVNYWTKEEYLRFIESMKDKNKYYYALEILYDAVVDKEEPWNNSPAYDTFEMRYCIVSTDTGEVLDDAQGYGYKTAQKAYAAFAYKNRDKSKDKEHLARKRHIEQWMEQNKSFVKLMDSYAFEIAKGTMAPNDKFDAKFVRKLLREESLETDFTAGELLKVWRGR